MTALEKFINKMNETSDFWIKNVKLITKKGEVVIVECDGWTFVSDENK